MGNEHIYNQRKVKWDNLKKYKVPPSVELVNEVIKKSRLKFVSRFAFVYGIPKDVITWYKRGLKELSPKYWHIFYDFEIVSKEYKAIAERYKTAKPKKNVLISNKNILDAFRK